MAARSDGRFAGMVGLYPTPSARRVWGMWVEPEHRRVGLGRQLLDAVLTWARTGAPTRPGRLSVHPALLAAGRLYERRGFVAAGRTEPLEHTPAVRTLELELRGPGPTKER